MPTVYSDTPLLEGDSSMLLATLLVPIGLIAFLLGMERLERWTMSHEDQSDHSKGS